MRGEFTAILQRGEEGFVASCAEVPGTQTEAATEEEAIENLADAISIIFEVNRNEAAEEAALDARRFRISVDLEESRLLQMEEEAPVISS